ncbi:hypothetical protein GOV11_05080 [Candidatus Woesearchaeota archaeon]|nr:hypothetical protein [Candidatus Woesearchaeota archaeon]
MQLELFENPSYEKLHPNFIECQFAIRFNPTISNGFPVMGKFSLRDYNPKSGKASFTVSSNLSSYKLSHYFNGNPSYLNGRMVNAYVTKDQQRSTVLDIHELELDHWLRR